MDTRPCSEFFLDIHFPLCYLKINGEVRMASDKLVHTGFEAGVVAVGKGADPTAISGSGGTEAPCRFTRLQEIFGLGADNENRIAEENGV